MMNYCKQSKWVGTRGGFTLLELILSLALTAVIAGIIGSLIQLYLTNQETGRDSVRQAQMARAILNMIAEDVRTTVRYQAFDTSGLQELLSSDSGGGASGGGGGGGAPSSGGSSGGGGATGGGSTGGAASGGQHRVVQRLAVQRLAVQRLAVQHPQGAQQVHRLERRQRRHYRPAFMVRIHPSKLM